MGKKRITTMIMKTMIMITSITPTPIPMVTKGGMITMAMGTAITITRRPTTP